jgi:HTH-type transcriptional regulator/antitoxin HipB
MTLKSKMTPFEIGQAIKTRRKSLGMNQSELAMVSGAGVRFISDLENGKPGCELGKTLAVLANLGLEIRIANQEGE